MSPCEVEFRPKGQEDWIKFPSNNPDDPPGSFSDVSGEAREIYLFKCEPDDSHTTIYRSKFGIDSELGTNGKTRVVKPTKGLEIVARIENGKFFDLDVTTERDHTGTFRFTHVEKKEKI